VALSEALKFNTTLKDLDLYNCGIGAVGGNALASALGTAALTRLDVGHNSLDEEAALTIVRAVWKHDCLTSLGLACCDIGPTGAKDIAAHIKADAVWTSLDLSDNRLCGIYIAVHSGPPLSDFTGTYDATGIASIAEVLTINSVLLSLDVSTAL
jgi:NLR family CARD domain-containing protein 3